MAQTFESTLVRQCALTLAGMKVGSLFCINFLPLEMVRERAAYWNEQLTPLGLSVWVLLERPDVSSALVYVWRTKQLDRMLSLPNYQYFLNHMGYQHGTLSAMLSQLSSRLQAHSEFPHEIGIFLGYPLRDVKGFIEHRGQNFTCCGLWKSYGNPVAMEKCFACYHRCINTCIQRYEAGTPIQELASSA